MGRKRKRREASYYGVNHASPREKHNFCSSRSSFLFGNNRNSLKRKEEEDVVSARNLTTKDTLTTTKLVEPDLLSSSKDRPISNIDSPKDISNHSSSGSLTRKKRRYTEIDFVYARETDKNGSAQTQFRPYVFGRKQEPSEHQRSMTKEETKEQMPNLAAAPTDDEKKDSSPLVMTTLMKTTSLRMSSLAKDVESQALSSIMHKNKNSNRRSVSLKVEDVIRDKTGNRPRANSTDAELGLPQHGLCEERQVLQSYAWKQGITSPFTPMGFANLGNTCFLNSTLQCLAYLPPFSQYLIQNVSSDHCSGDPKNHHKSFMNNNNNSNNPKQQNNQGKKITMILKHLISSVHGSQRPSGGVVPRKIVEALPLLSLGGKSYRFRPGRQEDAHEFLVHLLNAMNHGELLEAGINPNVRGWRDQLPVPRLDETTFVHRVFGGYLRSQVHCTNCGYNSNTYDPFLDLSLEVSRKSCLSLGDAMAEFSKKETLDEKNRWKCSGCKKMVCATKQMTVFRPPLTLCLQLKRFAFNSSSGGGGFGHGRFGSTGGRKITKPIQFPSHFKLPLSDGRSCEYKLTGAVIHLGHSATSGHYTAYIRKPTTGGLQDRWFHIDDSFVDAVDERTVLEQKDAYLLFYCRTEVVLEFPAPPLFSLAEMEDLEEDDGDDKNPTQQENHSSEKSNRLEHHQVDLEKSKDASHTKDPETNGRNVIAEDSEKSAVPISGKWKGDNHPTLPESGTERKELTREETHLRDARIAGLGNVDPGTRKDVAVKTGSIEKRVSEEDLDLSSNDPHGSSSNRSEESINRNKNKSSSVEQSTDPEKEFSANGKNNVSLKASQSSPTKPTRTKVVMDRGPGREKVECIVGFRADRKPKPWRPKTAPFTPSGNHDLLGNLPVESWGTDGSSPMPQERQHLVGRLDRNDKLSKRKMYVDQWDAKLDEGRKKKIKNGTFSPHDVRPFRVTEMANGGGTNGIKMKKHGHKKSH